MIAVYPGSFDPATNGHVDIVERAAALFDEVIVAVAPNSGKDSLFDTEERMEMLREVCGHLKNVTIDSFDGLLVSYLKKKNAKVIVRGLRAVSDFEYEFEMTLMNRKLAPSIETVFLMTSVQNSYLRSSIVKEIANLGGPVSCLVPPAVDKRLRTKLQKEAPTSNG